MNRTALSDFIREALPRIVKEVATEMYGRDEGVEEQVREEFAAVEPLRPDFDRKTMRVRLVPDENTAELPKWNDSVFAGLRFPEELERFRGRVRSCKCGFRGDVLKHFGVRRACGDLRVHSRCVPCRRAIRKARGKHAS